MPEASVFPVENVIQAPVGDLQPFGIDDLAGCLERHDFLQRAGQFFGRGDDFVPVLLPGLLDARDDLQQSRPPVATPLRDVGGRKERLFVGRHDDGQRPAAVPRHHLADGHVEVVDVGPLLAIHLDVDERIVQQTGDLFILKRLVRHHVAPVAGRIADRQEDRLVFGFSLFEGFLAPGPPVDRIVLVLLQIGTFFKLKAVRHDGFRFVPERKSVAAGGLLRLSPKRQFVPADSERVAEADRVQKQPARSHPEGPEVRVVHDQDDAAASVALGHDGGGAGCLFPAGG